VTNLWSGGKLYYGAAMGSVGVHLQYLLKAIFVASTFSYDQLHLHGSHPERDPLWSTEYVAFVHQGCKARKIDKIHFVVDTPIVLKTLRVCWVNPTGEYNYGGCEECLRTMIGLYIAGALERCQTFPYHINSERDLTLKTASQEAISKNREKEPWLGFMCRQKPIRR
jgi:hypothetical protein